MLIGTSSGSIGVLDVISHGYTTVMRSHSDYIKAIAFSDSLHEFSTACADSTIRVWDLNGYERYEFNCKDDIPECITYHPFEHTLAVGFYSGCVRIIDVPKLFTRLELLQHSGVVGCIAYNSTGTRLYSSAHCKTLCIYDATKNYQPLRLVNIDFPRGVVDFALSQRLDSSNMNGTELLAAPCDYPFTAVLLDAETLELKKYMVLDSSTSNSLQKSKRTSNTEFRYHSIQFLNGKELVAMTEHAMTFFSLEANCGEPDIAGKTRRDNSASIERNRKSARSVNDSRQ